MPSPSVASLHALLSEVTDDLAARSADAWRPTFRLSQGRREAESTATLKRSDGVTAWGQAPIQVVWKASELIYVAVLEYARAAAAIMVPPFRTWAPSTEVRAAVEAAAQISWLFDLKVPDGRTRVARYYTMRIYAARQLEYTYCKVQPKEPLHNYGMPLADVEAEAASLGLAAVLNKKNEVIGYEHQRVQKIDDLVQDIIGGNGAYSVLSGSAHSEFWSLLGGYQGQAPSPLGTSADEHESDPESFIPLVRACLQALFKPIDNACEMFDRPTLAIDLNRMYKNAVAVTGT